MTTLILDGVTYAAFCDAFHDVPPGKPVNRGHVAVQLEDGEIEALNPRRAKARRYRKQSCVYRPKSPARQNRKRQREDDIP